MAMESLETLLTQWRSIEPETVKIGRVKQDPVYQPRNSRLVPFKDRGRIESASGIIRGPLIFEKRRYPQ